MRHQAAQEKTTGRHDTGSVARNQPRFWKVTGCLMLSVGLTVPLAAAAVHGRGTFVKPVSYVMV